jgi:hypothetical protein
MGLPSRRGGVELALERRRTMRSATPFILAVLLLVVTPMLVLAGSGDVYLYDDAISADVDIQSYLLTGDVSFKTGNGNLSKVDPGPAPAPYPSIHAWEPHYEILGASHDHDGIRFVNVGQHWVKNKLALVLWIIELPGATDRTAPEFDEDLTLAMWVDWDGDEQWAKSEKVMTHHLNMHDLVPAQSEPMTVYYLTGFRVPDLEAMMSSNARWWNWKKDYRQLWVRGVLAYDDPDVSPDGEQLFGEVEDYRLSYMLMNKKPLKQ